MLQPPGSTIEEACGYRPGVNMSAVRGEFGGLNDDRYTLSRLEGEYYQRLDWMDCAFRHYRGTLAGARDYAKSHGSARLDQPERWIATRQMEHASNVEKQFVSEQKAFGTISDQMGQLSEQLKEQRRATRAANRPRVKRETEGQRYMRAIGPEPHMECLARSTTYAAHQNCWNNWLGVDMDAVAQDYYQWHDDYEAARRAMEQQ